MMLFIYRLFFPFVFPFFLPGLIWKLIRRPGHKASYWERFGIYSNEKKLQLREYQGGIWLHAVSVGETNLALTVLNKWVKMAPDQKFILSTTTTTGQEIARNKCPENVIVIFCPIDLTAFVRTALNLIKPSALVIFETELWPNLICMAKKMNVKTILVNTRISDKSFKGYSRFRAFFAPVLRCFDAIGVQTQTDKERLNVIAPDIDSKITVTGNIKFDQTPPEGAGFDFSTIFGTSHDGIVISASTHSPEEPLVISAFTKVRETVKNAKLVMVPRHAERGGEIEKMLSRTSFRYHRRSLGGTPDGELDVLLADTTGELAGFIKSSDIVIMGKTLAGNDEGQNIIEPAVMGKPIISGPKLKNFRQALDALKKNNAVRIVENESQLVTAMTEYLQDPEKAKALGNAAQATILSNRGALQKTLDLLVESVK